MDTYREAAQYYPLRAELYGHVAGIVTPRVRENETVADVIVGGAYVASLRSAARGGGGKSKSADSADLIFALSLFSWWPFMPDPAPQVQEQLVSMRGPLFEGLASGSIFDMERLRTAVPERTLRMDILELYQAQQKDVGAFLGGAGASSIWP